MGLISKIINYIKETRYNIGFIDGDLQGVIEGKPIKVNWMKHHYKDRWFADPFILDLTDNEIIVLAEEWYDPIQRGRISKLTIDKQTFELLNLKIMIETDYHLSFPAIDRKPDGIYIHPESCAINKLESYKYNPETDSFYKVGTLSELPLTDSVCNDYFGQNLMFSTKLPDANGKELGIYYWDSSNNRYALKEYYRFDENISRMAGNFFKYQGKIYRPAQVCIKSYGDAVSVQEVTTEKGGFSFKEIRRVYSPNPKLDLGFHTFNTYNDIIVVDAIGYRKAILCGLIRKTKRFLNRMILL
jgi:hypothetical protein